MKKALPIFLIFLSLNIISSPKVFAQSGFTRLIQYQAVLKDANGDALTGSYTLTFRLYDAETVGNTLWTEVHSETLTDGRVNVSLGSVTTLDTLGFDQDYWVGLQINADTEMTPRRQLSVSAYAITAKDAETLGGLSASELTKWEGSTDLYYTGGSIGIGLTNPSSQLHVSGDLQIGSYNDDDSSEAGYGSKLYFNGGPDWSGSTSHNSDPLWMARYNTGYNTSELRVNIGDDLSSTDKFSIGTTYWNDSQWHAAMSILMNGKIGIGTENPSTMLHIYKENPSTYETLFKVGTSDDSSRFSIREDGLAFADTGFVSGGGLVFNTSIFANTAGSHYIKHNKGTGASDRFIFRFSDNEDVLSIRGDSKVGIGTTSPGSTLDVSGGITPGKATSSPCADSGYQEGSMFYNDTNNYMCYCNGTESVQLHDPATACF